MRYRDFNGMTFSGHGPVGVVQDMQRYAWLVASKGEYMRDVAQRVAELTGGAVQVDVTGARAFLASLVEANFLKEEA